MISVVFGTRAEVIKFSSIIRELKRKKIKFQLIDIGQHDTRKLTKQLKLPKPDYYFGESWREKWSRAFWPIAVLMAMVWGFGVFIKLRRIFKNLEKNDVVLLHGNCLSVPLGVFAIKSLPFKKPLVIHCESGLRGKTADSFLLDLFYKIGDHNSDILFAQSEKCWKNLIDENVKGKTVFTGDPVADVVSETLKLKTKAKIPEINYVVANSVRSLKNKRPTERFLDALVKSPIRIIYIVNPRIEHELNRTGFMKALKENEHISVVRPLDYITYLNLIKNSCGVITDSNTVQEECAVLKKPCIVTNNFIQLPELEKIGVVRLTGCDTEKILNAMNEIKEKTGIYNTAQKSEFAEENENATKKIVDEIEKLISGKMIERIYQKKIGK